MLKVKQISNYTNLSIEGDYTAQLHIIMEWKHFLNKLLNVNKNIMKHSNYKST